MSTKARWYKGIQEFFEGDTQETVMPMAPVVFVEDFLGKAIDTTNIWTLLDTGAATEALVADAPNGVVALAMDATNEAQLAGLSWGDQRTLVLNQGLIGEFRFRYTTLLTGAAIGVVGFMGDTNADPDAVAESIWFRSDASGVITVETDDTANETSKVATGVTLALNEFAIGRIDCTDINDVRFYINGNRVASGTTFKMSQVAALKLQPVTRVSKAASTNVGTMEVDTVRTWQRRAA